MIDTLQTLAADARTLRAGRWSFHNIEDYLDRVIAYADQQDRLYADAAAAFDHRAISDAHVEEDWQLDHASHYGQGKAVVTP